MKTRSVKISARTRARYQKRDRRLDLSGVPQLPPAQWAKGIVGLHYRPAILKEGMEGERR